MKLKGSASIAIALVLACAGCAARIAPGVADVTPSGASRATSPEAPELATTSENPELRNGSAEGTRAAAIDAPAAADRRTERGRPDDRGQAPPATASVFVFSPQQAVPAVPAVGESRDQDARASEAAPADAQPSSEPGELRLSVIASASEIAPGAIMTVDVMAASSSAVVDAPIHLTFDPRVVEYVDGATGDFLAQGGSSVVFIADGRSRPGDVAIAAGRIEREQGARGTGLLCRVRFRGVDTGTSAVQVGHAQAWGTRGEALAVRAVGTSVVVN